ncbi:hypothetical protein ACLOJK_039356 [Asimina triloba]
MKECGAVDRLPFIDVTERPSSDQLHIREPSVDGSRHVRHLFSSRSRTEAGHKEPKKKKGLRPSRNLQQSVQSFSSPSSQPDIIAKYRKPKDLVRSRDPRPESAFFRKPIDASSRIHGMWVVLGLKGKTGIVQGRGSCDVDPLR